jgi:hypothetical protein
VCANTWDDFSQLRESLWAPLTLYRDLRESVESPPYLKKKPIVSVKVWKLHV